jgi:hypothetical protein
MRPDGPRGLPVALLAALVACGCASAPKRDAASALPAQPAPDRNQVQAQSLAFYLELLHRFAKATPSEQAEIFANVRRDFETTPTPSSRLRYALALAVPGHPASDPVVAQGLLRELLASPEQLAPVEHAAAYLELLQVDRQLAAAADLRRLQAESERGERERLATLTRRLQSESEENARLRRALEDAQSKLDAIANIERDTTANRPPRNAP